jgi:hypothetical protein
LSRRVEPLALLCSVRGVSESESGLEEEDSDQMMHQICDIIHLTHEISPEKELLARGVETFEVLAGGLSESESELEEDSGWKMH